MTKLLPTGDGLALIKKLKAGRINRFWSSKREMLQKYFEENGYIDYGDRLTREEIQLRVRAALANEIQLGLITII